MVEIGQYIIIAMSLFLAVGGFIGMAKARSVISLISGLVSSLLLIACYFLSQTQSSQAFTYAVAVCALMAVIFAWRFRQSGKFMPAGLLMITCTLCSGILGYILATFNLS